MNVDQLVEWELAGETEVIGENPLQCHFNRQSNPGRRRGKLAANRLSYGTARIGVNF
jgi:hypothetical protein